MLTIRSFPSDPTFDGIYRWTLGPDCRGTGTLTFTNSPRAGQTLQSTITGPPPSGKRPFKVFITFHAQNLPTTPPLDGGTCPAATVQAIVTGKIVGQRTPNGDIQGGGDVAATPHLSKCRVPVINFRIVDAQLSVLSPGKRLRLQLAVRISGSGVHRPGDCRVNTSGTIVAIYDDTLTVSNGLRDHRLTIGPWQAPGCTAHNDTITNSITSIPADAGSSTWVRVSIACPGPPDAPGYSPKNCT